MSGTFCIHRRERRPNLTGTRAGGSPKNDLGIMLNRIRPSWLFRAIRFRIVSGVDYCRYAVSLRRTVGAPRGVAEARATVLFVAGRGMNVTWAQIWVVLSRAFAQAGLAPAVLLMRRQRLLRAYFALVRARVFYLEDVLASVTPSFDPACLEACRTVEDWKALKHDAMPVGEMVLSTYCRHNATGLIDPSCAGFQAMSQNLAVDICRAYAAARALFAKGDVGAAVFTETFIEEYGGFYYAALAADVDIIKMSGTVRDNAIVVQRRTYANERLHHAALTDPAWEFVLNLPGYERISAAVDQNFSDRYGDKWLRSKRNQSCTAIVTRQEGRAQLGITEDRKVAVIFSHILYDALFHYGDELFQDYATWLAETVKIAAANPRVDWYVKLHPSNLWRGEFQSVLGGRYEEEKVINEMVGELPEHVKLIYADTQISPYGWYQIADYGLCVRGTAGLEMACLGKPVITAGTGRYEGRGFTMDAASIGEYRSILMNLSDVSPLSPEQVERARRYAYGLFALKPLELTSLEPALRTGVRTVRASDDMIYLPKPTGPLDAGSSDLDRLAAFLRDRSQLDLLMPV